jgi:hypothetical protein
MSASQIATRIVRSGLPMLLWTSGLAAQTCLLLSPANITGNTALLDLSLYSPRGMAPAALQWTFQYASSSISSFTVDDGPTLTSAGKSAICIGNAAAYNCLAVGLNTNLINNGIITRITAVLAPGASAPIIHIMNPRAASAIGNLMPIGVRILPSPDLKDSSVCKLLPRPRGVSSR